MGNSVVTLNIPGYAPGLNVGVPETNDVGGRTDLQVANEKIPPVVWMIIFLVVGYIGLRLLME